MLTSCLVPQRVSRERGRRDPELAGHEDNHRLREMLAASQALTGMTQQAQLDGEAEPVAGAPLGPDERQIFAAQHVMLRHLGGARWGCRTGGCAVRATVGLGGTSRPPGDGGGPFIKRLPFRAILKQDCESRLARHRRGRSRNAQTFVCESRQGPVARLCPRLQGRRTEQCVAGQGAPRRRLPAHFRGSRVGRALGSAGATTHARPIARGRYRRRLETRPPIALAERCAAHHGADRQGRRGLPLDHRG